MHIDDILIFSKKKCWINLFVKSLSKVVENFKLTDKSIIDKYLRVDIMRYQDGTYKLK